MSLKVIGAGFGRTGTLSLKAALEELGFGPCYHMQEVLTHPARAKFWYEASLGKPVDWEMIFRGYQATVDWPACTFYRELMAAYPEAKVILTVRDPEGWYQSGSNTIYRLAQVLPWWFWCLPIIRYGALMAFGLIWDGTFHGRYEDKPYAKDIFNRHIAEVKEIVPPERLLVYNIKEGWAPLCRFLNVPIPPGKPFPHLNDTAQFQRLIMGLILLRWLAPIFVGGLLGFTLTWILRRNNYHCRL